MKRSLSLALLVGLLMTVMVAGSLGAQTVVRYTRWAGGSENQTFKALVDEFNKSQNRVVVKFEALPWSAYWEKLRTNILSGDAPDVITLSNAGDAGAYLSKGVFLDLATMQGARQAFQATAPLAQQSLTQGNRILAMPVGIGVRALVYNKKLLQEAGVPFPSADKPMTWDQFFQISAKLLKKDASGNVTQYPAYFSYTEMYENLLAAYGVKTMDNYTRPTRVTLNTPQGVRALEQFTRLFKDSVVPPNNGEWQTAWGNPDSAVATGKVAFMHTGPWNLSAVDQAKIDYGTAPLPMGTQRGMRGYINSVAIYRGTKVKDAAWTFVRWLSSREGQIAFARITKGDLPANTEVARMAMNQNWYSTSQANLRAFFTELPYVFAGPMLPTSEWQGLVESTISDMTTFKISPAEAAAKMEKDGNSLIQALLEDE